MQRQHPELPYARPTAPRLSRRRLVILAGGAAAAIEGVSLVAQSSPSPAAPSDLDKAALESHRQNSAVLAAFDVPMSLEPAFQFKA